MAERCFVVIRDFFVELYHSLDDNIYHLLQGIFVMNLLDLSCFYACLLGCLGLLFCQLVGCFLFFYVLLAHLPSPRIKLRYGLR